MNCKLIASELLCAALLLGCSSAPKLTLPSGDWVEVNQPGATPAPKASSAPSPPSPGAAPVVSIPTPRAPIAFGASSVKPVTPGSPTTPTTPAPLAPSAPVAAVATPPKVIAASPAAAPAAAPGSPAVTAPKPLVTQTTAPPKTFTTPSTPPVVFGASTPSKENVAVRPMPPPKETWTVSPADATLRRVLAKWTARAGWQLVWEASVDVPVTVNASFDGDFRSAVKRLFSSLSAADVNLNGLMYSGNRVLRVTESGRRAE